MQGFAGGASCWADVATAAAAQCGSVSGTSTAGVASCDAVVDVAATAATLRYRWTGATQATTVEAQWVPPPCERFDMSYWGPILAAAFLAVIAVKCVYAAIAPLQRKEF